jgi:hypothetical protein
MASAALRWFLACGLSLAAHVALAVWLHRALAPDPIPFAPEPQARFSVAAEETPAQRAEPEPPEGDAVGAGEDRGAEVGVSTLRATRAAPAAAAARRVGGATADVLARAAASDARRAARAVEAVSPDAPAFRSATPAGVALATRSTLAPSLAASPPEAESAQAPEVASGATAASIATGGRAVDAALALSAAAPARPQPQRPALGVAPDALSASSSAPAARMAKAVESASARLNARDAPPDAMAVAPITAPAEPLQAGGGVAAAAVVSPSVSGAVLGDAVSDGRRVTAARSAAARIVAEGAGAALTEPRSAAGRDLDAARGSARSAPPTEMAALAAAPLSRAGPEMAARLDAGAAETGAAVSALPAPAIPAQSRSATGPAQPPAPAGIGPALDGAPAPASRAEATATAAFAALAAPGAVAGAAARAVEAAPNAAPATVGWIGDADARLDPATVSAIGAFAAPRAARDGRSVGDAIGAALSRAPCSRLSASFAPMERRVVLRGHAPSDAVAETALADVRAAVDGAFPVVVDVARLPEPQCGLLRALDALGLPQSNDQADDPLSVGRAAEARRLRLEDGDPIILALESADYDAFLYIDFFDSSGMVTHLKPPPGRLPDILAAQTRWSIGGGAADGSGVSLAVAPPFGVDLVAVFAASRRVFDAPRPPREDAGAYLAAFAERVSALAAADPAFRGEWAYLVLETYPQGGAPNAIR